MKFRQRYRFFFYSLMASLKTGFLFAIHKNFQKVFAMKLFAFFKFFKKYSLYISQIWRFWGSKICHFPVGSRPVRYYVGAVHELENSHLTVLILKRWVPVKFRVRNKILVLPGWFWKLLNKTPTWLDFKTYRKIVLWYFFIRILFWAY